MIQFQRFVFDEDWGLRVISGINIVRMFANRKTIVARLYRIGLKEKIPKTDLKYAIAGILGITNNSVIYYLRKNKLK
jgi:hypothetical protein